MRLLVLVLVLGLAPLARAQETPAREGEVVHYREETVTWRPPAGSYVLHVRAGEADVEARWLRPDRGVAQTVPQPATQPGGRGENVTVNASVQTLGPHHGFGSAVNLSDGGPLTLAFSGGGGRALLARMDLVTNGTGNGTVATLSARGTLGPGECRAYSFGDSFLGNVPAGRGVLRGDAMLEADGPGVRFRLLDAPLRTLHEADDAMGVPLPQETLEAFENHWLHVQACAPQDAPDPLPFVVRVTRTDSTEADEARLPRDVPLPPVMLALAAAALLARRRMA